MFIHYDDKKLIKKECFHFYSKIIIIFAAKYPSLWQEIKNTAFLRVIIRDTYSKLVYS
jgi:hypothetical protein